jgi:hypothetical protein
MSTRPLLLVGALLIAAPAGADDLYATVYTRTDDGERGRRVHRTDLLAEPAEKQSARITLCGRDYFGDEATIEALAEYQDEAHSIHVYQSRIDPQTRNVRREELCRSGSAE